MSVQDHLRRGPSRGASGGGRYGQSGESHVVIATVGHGEDGTPWAWTEAGQVLIHVTYQTGDQGHQGTARLAEGVMHLELSVGQQVVIVKVGGNDSHAVILSALRDMEAPAPTTVAGVATGSTTAATRSDKSGAPAFTFVRTGAGRMLAIETGDAGDLVIHAGAGVEIKAAASSAIHLAGRVHAGRGYTTPPVGATVGPEETTEGVVAGTPGVAHVPAPLAIPTLPEPYAGAGEGVLRAKDVLQSNPAIDPDFWTWLAAVGTGSGAGPPPGTFIVRTASASQALTAADDAPQD